MSTTVRQRDRGSQLTRRNFLGGAGAGLFVLGASRGIAWGQSATQTVLSGTQFDLHIGETPVNFTGQPRIGTVVNGQVPAPLLRWREGDTAERLLQLRQAHGRRFLRRRA